MKKLLETASNSEKNNEQVDKMAEAARALRWSEQIDRVQSITKMQIQTMDHMMDARGEPIKLPDPKTASPPALLSKLKSYCRALARPAVYQTRKLFQMAAMNLCVSKIGFDNVGGEVHRDRP
jgi:hypothetical protein